MNTETILFWYLSALFLMVALISSVKILNYIKKRALENIVFKNDLMAFSYMIINVGPNVMAFSIVEFLISSDKENKATLVLVFLSGILLTYFGRKLRDLIARKTSKAYEKKVNSSFKEKVMEVKNS